MQTANIVICGGGILGLTLARELVKRGHEDILILEKESGLGKHASGRNSGVLHAGIYYAPGTARATSCMRGNRMMRDYCVERGLPILEAGKVIVARTHEELPTLHELHERSVKNGAKVDLLDEKQLADYEPNARTCEKALFSHYTAQVDPRRVLEELRKDVLATGKVNILFDCKVLARKGERGLDTSQGLVEYKVFVNASGAHCDTIATMFGLGDGYKIIPFKGVYRKLKKEYAGMVNGNIYPVPNIKNPFLGVHFTKSPAGDVYLGPTAIPAFSRENYGVLKGLDAEAPEIIWRDAMLFFRNTKFRAIALEEPKKYFFKYFFADAKKLVKKLEPEYIESTPKVGIRPQLVDVRNNELVMDFLIVNDAHSVHVLNAISPAFTSSMYFAEVIAGEYVEKVLQ